MPRQRRSRWGHIETVVPGEVYRIHWPEGRDASGRRSKQSRTVRGTWDDAAVELAKEHAAAHARQPAMDESLVDFDTTWRMFWWLVTEPSMKGLAAKTRSDYERTWSAEMEPRIADDIVSQTTYRQVCKVIADVSSSSVQRSVHRLWKKMCNQAMHEQILDSNPVDRTVPMKRHVKRVKHTLEASELMPYLSSLKGTRYQAYYTALSAGGMRSEEAIALLGSDLERVGEYAVAHVRAALTSADNKRDYKGTKNMPSERDVWFAEPFATLMLAAAPGEGPLFPGPCPVGEEPNATWFAHPDRMRANFKAWCERNEVEYKRPLDMRTLFSDLCAEAGAPDSSVDIFMGHAGGDGTTRGRNYMTRRRKSMQMVADMFSEYVMEESACYNVIQGEGI